MKNKNSKGWQRESSMGDEGGPFEVGFQPPQAATDKSGGCER